MFLKLIFYSGRGRVIGLFRKKFKFYFEVLPNTQTISTQIFSVYIFVSYFVFELKEVWNDKEFRNDYLQGGPRSFFLKKDMI